MRKIIFGLAIILLTGCNQKKSTDTAQNQDTVRYDSNEENSANNELPASNYFKITKVNFARYLKDGQFEMDFDLLNNTDYKFSRVRFSADIFYKMKNSDDGLQATVQNNDWQPYSDNGRCDHILNWEPMTTKHIYFISRYGGCSSYERTPDEITLIIMISNAVSVDFEIEGAFAKYDLLELWKGKQVEEGLR